jgi:hypothetical protein
VRLTLPTHLEEEWAIWRLVTSDEFRGQQIHYLMNDCTLDEIMDMNIILDSIAEAKARAAKKAKKAKRNGTA